MSNTWDATNHTCPECGGALRFHKFKKFFGCGNFPRCNYTTRQIKTDHSCECGNGNLIYRNGKFGAFYGCSDFPKCRNTYQVPPKVSTKKFVPTVEQIAIFQNFRTLIHGDSLQHIVVGARAGSGKSSTGVWIESEIAKEFPDKSILFSTFGKDPQLSLAKRGVNAKTSHSLGHRDLLSNGYVFDDNKYYNQLQVIFQEPGYSEFKDKELALITAVSLEAISDIREQLRDHTSSTEVLKSVEKVLFGKSDLKGEIVNICIRLLTWGTSDKCLLFDQTDAIWLPIVKQISPVEMYNGVIVDEAQDWNPCQIEFILRYALNVILWIGDDWQSIYMWRGAMARGMVKIAERFDALRGSLTVTFRNPASHVALQKQLMPTIEVECGNTRQGEIADLNVVEFYNQVKTGDVVLCAHNAPLVQTAVELMGIGKPVLVTGKEYHKKLRKVIYKNEPESDSVEELLVNLQSYDNAQQAKFQEKQTLANKKRLEDHIDLMGMIYHLVDGVETILDIYSRIDKIFLGNRDEAIILSTVHRFKGDEAENVYLIRRDLLASEILTPDKVKDIKDEQWEKYCVLYVAISRAIENMYFVAN